MTSSSSQVYRYRHRHSYRRRNNSFFFNTIRNIIKQFAASTMQRWWQNMHISLHILSFWINGRFEHEKKTLFLEESGGDCQFSSGFNSVALVMNFYGLVRFRNAKALHKGNSTEMVSCWFDTTAIDCTIVARFWSLYGSTDEVIQEHLTQKTFPDTAS